MWIPNFLGILCSSHVFSSLKMCTIMCIFFHTVIIIATAYSPSSFYAPSLPTYLKDNVRAWNVQYIIFYPSCVFSLLQFNQTPLQIGLLYFSPAASYLLFALPVGPLTDKVVSFEFHAGAIKGVCMAHSTHSNS
jgi:hypothetical protein